MISTEQDRLDTKAIEDAGLLVDGKMLAQIMWAVRNFVLERQAHGPVKPIEEWTMADIIALARSAGRGFD